MVASSKTTILAVLAAACLAFAAQSVGASESVCAESACVTYHDEASGEGSCEEAAEHSEFRGASVTVSDERSATGAYVGQYCWAYAAEGGSATGRGASVAVSRLDWETFQQDGVFVTWDSGRVDGEPSCAMMVHTDAPVAPGIGLPLGCPLGDAPPMLPALA